MTHLLALLLLDCFWHPFLLPAAPLGVQAPSAKVLGWDFAGKIWAHWCFSGHPGSAHPSGGRAETSPAPWCPISDWKYFRCRCSYSLFLFLSIFASGFAVRTSTSDGKVFQVSFIWDNREAQVMSLTQWPVPSVYSWSQDRRTPVCLLYSSFLAVSLQTLWLAGIWDLTFRSSGCPRSCWQRCLYCLSLSIQNH